ncbi:MAG: arylesterase [Arenimonas sp.]
MLLLALALLPASIAAKTLVPARSGGTVVVFGDSLSAGYGLANGEGWVTLTAQRLPVSNPGWSLVNASISGETTAGGAARIAGVLARHHPRVVVIELGANDGLRGLDLKQMQANLERIVLACQQSGAHVLLVGMRMPPNFGQRYTRGFEQVYTDLVGKYHLAFVPFLLAPVASDREAFQADNLHPVAAAQPKLRDHVWRELRPLLNAAPAPLRPVRAATGSGG